jgi:glycosyltransferase involved in cell wall biosynthesis
MWTCGRAGRGQAPVRAEVSGHSQPTRGRAASTDGVTVRLLYVIDSLVPAGAERSLEALAPHYVARGVRLDVAYLHERAGLQRELEDAGARLFSLAGRGGRAGWLARTVALVRRLRPDLVHTTLFEADVTGRAAARLAGVPVVSSLVNETYGPAHLGDPQLRRWKVRAAQLVDGATARFATRLHAVSAFVANTMAWRLRFPRERIDVVPRARDPVRLGRRTPERRDATRARLDVDSRSPLVLAVARQEHQKGLDVLLEALALVQREVTDARLIVAGRPGNQTPALLELVERLGLRDAVRFLGSRDDVPDLLCAADVLALPSRREGFPGAMVEAMALEVPIVASDLPQVREVVDASGASLVPPGSPEALAAEIGHVLVDPEGAAGRVERAQTRFRERLTVDRVADEMIAFYGRALAGTPGWGAGGAEGPCV